MKIISDISKTSFTPREQREQVNHPKHYNAHPSGIEAIVICEHMNFCIGNAMKYLWRAGNKGDALEDLKKARWYLDREIQRLERPTKTAI